MSWRPPSIPAWLQPFADTPWLQLVYAGLAALAVLGITVITDLWPGGVLALLCVALVALLFRHWVLLLALPSAEPVEVGASALFTREYRVDSALDFYNRIAPEHDSRNSESLRKTHRAVVDRIEECVAQRAAWSVLDLGGGSGNLIASHFYRRGEGSWTYVDFSPAMRELFLVTMADADIATSALGSDIDTYIELAGGSTQHDAIVMSFVLSSMPSDPDWQALGRLIRPDGELIIADADAFYTATHPHYSVRVDDQTYALRTRPVVPTELEQELEQQGWARKSTHTIKDGDTHYSFVLTFSKSVGSEQTS